MSTVYLEKNSEIKDDYYFSFIIKIFASAMVVINHTMGFSHIDINKPSLSLYLSIGIFAVCKTAVPLFIMVTGFYSLRSSKKYTTKSYIKKIAFDIFLLYFMTYMYHTINNYLSDNINPFDYTNLYANNITTIYWYFYLIIGLDFMIPFLKKITDNSSIKELVYLVFITFFIQSFLPILLKRSSLPPINFQFVYMFFSMPVCYLFLGQLIYKLKDKFYKNIKTIILSFLLFLNAFILYIFLMVNEVFSSSDFNILFWDDRNAFYIFIESLALFIMFYAIFSFVKPLKKLMSLLSSATLFVFTCSDIIRLVIYKKQLSFHSKPIIHNFLFFLIVYISCMLIGVIFYLLKSAILNMVTKKEDSIQTD